MELNWYAIYTKHNTEEVLRECILQHSQRNNLAYETYLPLREEIKKWRDRIKVKKLPLFRNYLFVKHDDNAFHKIKNMKGFCDYIRFGSAPSIIPPEQMDIIKKVVQYQKGKCCQSHKLVRGKRVKICRGVLAGFEGVLLEDQMTDMLAIEIKSLKLFLHVQVPMSDVVII